jgi:hypothetical protein
MSIGFFSCPTASFRMGYEGRKTLLSTGLTSSILSLVFRGQGTPSAPQPPPPPPFVPSPPQL